jgi:hypothetical protein
MFLSESVTKPMEVKTEILINAKETPTMVNSNLKNQKFIGKRHYKTHTAHQNKAISIDLLIPILGKKRSQNE